MPIAHGCTRLHRPIAHRDHGPNLPEAGFRAEAAARFRAGRGAFPDESSSSGFMPRPFRHDRCGGSAGFSPASQFSAPSPPEAGVAPLAARLEDSSDHALAEIRRGLS